MVQILKPLVQEKTRESDEIGFLNSSKSLHAVHVQCCSNLLGVGGTIDPRASTHSHSVYPYKEHNEIFFSQKELVRIVMNVQTSGKKIDFRNLHAG